MPSALEKMGKFFIWITFVLVFGFYVYDALIKSSQDIVYIETFQLPEELEKTGMSGKLFTEQVVVETNQILEKYYSKQDKPFLEDKLNLQKLGANACIVSEYPFPEIFKELINNIHSSIISSTRRIELTLPETGLSIRIFEDAINRFHGSKKMRLNGNIIKLDSNGGFNVQVTAEIGDEFLHNSSYEAINLDIAKRAASLLILKYANPGIYASEVHVNNPSGVEESILIATKFKDEYKSISLPWSLLGYLVLNRQESAIKAINYARAEKYFEKALEIEPSDDLAKLGIAMSKANMAIGFRDIENLLSEYKNGSIDRFDQLVKKGNQISGFAFSGLAWLYEGIGDLKNAERVWNTSLPFTSSDPNIVLSYSLYLIRNQRYEEATKALNKIIFNFPPDWRKVLGESIIKAETKSIEEADNYFSALIGHFHPCAIPKWIDYLGLRASREKNPSYKEDILRLENAQFAKAEYQGVKGFHFYNGWAGVLSELKKFDAAITKYDLAMKYFGDKTWALMNKGNMLAAKGDYKGAEILYKISLEDNNGTYMAVKMYLQAIFSQNDFERYLEQYEVFKNEIKGDRLHELKIAVGIAHCRLNHLKQSEDIIFELKDKGLENTQLYVYFKECLVNLNKH